MAWWVVAIGMAVKYGGTFASMALQYNQAKDAKEMAEHKAEIIRQQASEENRNRALKEGTEREASARKLAKMEARYAKSGLEISGTPLYMMQEQTEIDEFNILAKNRASEIWQQDREYEAKMAEYEGEATMTGTKWSMIGQGLQAVGSDIASFGMKGLGGGKNPAGGAGAQGASYGARTAPTIQAPSAPNYGPYGAFQPQMNTINSYGIQREFSMAT